MLIGARHTENGGVVRCREYVRVSGVHPPPRRTPNVTRRPRVTEMGAPVNERWWVGARCLMADNRAGPLRPSIGAFQQSGRESQPCLIACDVDRAVRLTPLGLENLGVFWEVPVELNVVEDDALPPVDVPGGAGR
jgi:hypothetical protein